jgi:hypothetical protein
VQRPPSPRMHHKHSMNGVCAWVFLTLWFYQSQGACLCSSSTSCCRVFLLNLTTLLHLLYS